MTSYRTIESSSVGNLMGASWIAPNMAALLAVAVATATGWGAPVVRRANEPSVRVNIHDGAFQASPLTTYDMLAARSLALQDQLLELGGLPDNWDGLGARSPETPHVKRLIELVGSLPVHLATYKPMIGADGEIGVYWSKGNRFADLSVDPDGETLLYLRELSQANGRLFEVTDPHRIDENLVREIEAHLT